MPSPSEYPVVTVGLLMELLQAYPDDYRLDFSGLSFYRLKQRAPTHVQVEFNQTVCLDDKGRVVVENH
jgi:hypothetical protein